MKTLLLLTCFFVIASAGKIDATPTKSNDFHNLTLEKCIRLALVHNPTLRIASQQFLNAEGRALQLHAILYPTVSAQGLTTPLTFYVQIQETFYSRATFPQLRLSRLTHEQAFINYRQAVIDVIFQVRQAFTTELAAQKSAEVSRQLIQERTAAAKNAQQLFNAGRAQRSDILPLQVLTNLSQQNETLADLRQQQSALAFRSLLGVELPANIIFEGNLANDPGPSNLDVGKLSAEALRDRQDLKLLESAKLSAEQQIEIDLKNAYPIVGFESNSAIQPPSLLPGSAGFDLERNDSQPETQRQAGDTQLPLSLYFNWTIFDGGNLAGVKASEKAQIASQADAIEALKTSIPGEVALSVANIQAEQNTLRLIHAETSPEEARRQIDVDYQAGRVRLLDKINLETDIVRQQQLQLNSQMRLSLALAALDHALGRGLEVAATSHLSP